MLGKNFCQETIRSLISSSIYSWGWLGGKIWLIKEGMRILTYHRINARKHPYLSVPPNQFEEQMAYLFNNGYRVISLTDFFNYQEGDKTVKNKLIILTFDDGYADNYDNAYPVLRRFGFPATIFLATGFIGKTYLEEKMLNWGQVKEMSENRIDFGSHSLTHPFLTTLSFAKARYEISASKAIIEKTIGKKVDFFCYPSGDFNEQIKQLVKEAGYLGACSVFPGGNNYRTDFFQLRRTEISPKDSLFDFKKKLSGAYDPLHKLNLLSMRMYKCN